MSEKFYNTWESVTRAVELVTSRDSFMGWGAGPQLGTIIVLPQVEWITWDRSFTRPEMHLKALPLVSGVDQRGAMIELGSVIESLAALPSTDLEIGGKGPAIRDVSEIRAVIGQESLLTVEISFKPRTVIE